MKRKRYGLFVAELSKEITRERTTWPLGHKFGHGPSNLPCYSLFGPPPEAISTVSSPLG